MTPEKTITIALDGTGGDKVDGKSIASAVRFAVVLCPNLKVLVFGDQDLKVALEREKIDGAKVQVKLRLATKGRTGAGLTWFFA